MRRCRVSYRTDSLSESFETGGLELSSASGCQSIRQASPHKWLSCSFGRIFRRNILVARTGELYILNPILPSTLLQSNGPVTLNRATMKLYGDDGYGRNRTVCLSTVLKTTVHTLRPSERNRLYRFTAQEFTQPPIPSTLQESFGKALQEAMDDDGEDEPLDLDTIRAKASQTREHASSPVQETISERNGEEGHRWESPPPPENLMIPGEPVLCRNSRSDGHTVSYWPAKIMKYIPPIRRNGQAKYEVHFFDRETAKVSRDQFFTCFDEGFSSCMVCSLNESSLWVVDWISLGGPIEAPQVARDEWSRRVIT